MIHVENLVKTFGEVKAGLTHFGLATDVGVLSVVAAAFLMLGAYSFSRIQI
jgi:hypothetical protein